MFVYYYIAVVIYFMKFKCLCYATYQSYIKPANSTFFYFFNYITFNIKSVDYIINRIFFIINFLFKYFKKSKVIYANDAFLKINIKII